MIRGALEADIFLSARDGAKPSSKNLSRGFQPLKTRFDPDARTLRLLNHADSRSLRPRGAASRRPFARVAADHDGYHRIGAARGFRVGDI